MKRLFQTVWGCVLVKRTWTELPIAVMIVAALGMTHKASASHSDIAGNWHLDEGAGQVAGDASGHANHGQLGTTPGADANDPTWISGKFATALRFDGNDFVEVADSPTLEPSEITAEAWVRSSGPGSYRYVLSKGANGCLVASYAIYTGGGGGLFFYISNGSSYRLSPGAGTGIWDGNWHHVAGTFDGSTVRLYVDGAEVGSGSPTSLSIGYGLPTNERFYIGTYGGTCDLHFTGDIDEVRIWTRALTASEVARRANGEELSLTVAIDIKPTSCPNPLNVNSKGVLPVAILGTEDFDVAEIDVSTVRLVGVPPLRSNIEDVETPFDGDCLDCASVGTDGILDLTLKFNTQDIVAALVAAPGDLNDRDKLCLILTGNLFGGTPITGEDGVLIINKGKGGGELGGVGSSTLDVFALFQNNPNPFARETSISYTLPASGYTTLKVYDTSGRLVTTLVDAEMNAGIYSTSWNRKDAASGVYIYRLTNNGNSVTRKMTVLR